MIRRSAAAGARVTAGLVCGGGEFDEFTFVRRGVGGELGAIVERGYGLRGGGKLAGFRSGSNGGWCFFLWRLLRELGDALAVGAFIGGGGAGAPVVVGDAFVPFGAGFGSGGLRLGGSGGERVFLERTHEVPLLVPVDLHDGHWFGREFLAEFRAVGDGARDGGGGDLAAVDGFAGDGAGEVVVEEAVENFGEHELDGGAVFENGNFDLAAAEVGFGVAVGEAEVTPVEGDLAALFAFGGEVAAVVGDVGVGFGGGGGDFGRGCVRVRHLVPFKRGTGHRAPGRNAGGGGREKERGLL